MEVMQCLKKYSDKKILKLIYKNKLIKEEVIISSIREARNELIKKIFDNYDLNFDYKNNGIYISAIINGNTLVLNLLKNKGVNLPNKIKNLFSPLSMIRDINTLKYFNDEFNNNKNREVLNQIAYCTLPTHNLELLKYLVNNYKIELKSIKEGKNTFLDTVKSHVNDMQRLEQEKRNMVFFIDELLFSEGKKYEKIRTKAYEILNKIKEQNKELNVYYKYIKEKCSD